MPGEFDLIRDYFTRATRHTDLGVGDDAALLRVGSGMQLVASCDMLVEGTHFLAGCDAAGLGWKTLAVSISDLAAMAARPRWAMLALSLPEADPDWLKAFAEGFMECCEAFGVDLIGGDTTRGPLNLCATVLGEAPTGTAVTRDGGRAGDDLWVTGQPGRAALGLAHLAGRSLLPAPWSEEFLGALHRPQPRLGFGLRLRGLARAMLDVSDGLLGDLGHILDRSGVGARIDRASLPLGPLLAPGVSEEAAMQALLAGGDDYELLFSAPPEARPAIAAAASESGLPVHRIGSLTAARGQIELLTEGGLGVPLDRHGYDHFAADR